MSDKAPKSELARKALAQRAERNRLAEEDARRQRAAEVREEDIAAKWPHISRRILETYENINIELEDTGTVLVATEEPNDARNGLIGGYQIGITRDGEHAISQKIYMRYIKDGKLNTFAHLGMGKNVKEQHYDFDDIDNAGIDTLIRAFVDEALT